MRVKKMLDGTFQVEDEPILVEGVAADRFVRAMQERDEVGNDTERRRFLDECDRAYATSVAKHSAQ